MVGAAAHGCRRARLVRCVLDVGRVPERPLFRRAVPVAVLLAVSLPLVPSPDVWRWAARHLPAAHRAPFAGVPDPDRAAVVPADLLLLPQGLLPVLLARADGLRGARREARLFG